MHSVIALNARYVYRESRDARELDMLYGVAVASLYGNSKSDLKAGSEAVNDRFGLARGRIPYYNIRSRSIAAEREHGVRLLRILSKNVTEELGLAEDKRLRGPENSSGKQDI